VKLPDATQAGRRGWPLRIESILFKKVWLCLVGLMFVGAAVVLIRIERATEDWDYAIYAGAAFFIAARLWWVAFLLVPRRTKHK
jgi:hypothetical protein